MNGRMEVPPRDPGLMSYGHTLDVTAWERARTRDFRPMKCFVLSGTLAIALMMGTLCAGWFTMLLLDAARETILTELAGTTYFTYWQARHGPELAAQAGAIWKGGLLGFGVWLLPWTLLPILSFWPLRRRFEVLVAERDPLPRPDPTIRVPPRLSTTADCVCSPHRPTQKGTLVTIGKPNNPDRLADLNILRMMQLANERTVRESGPLPPGGLPVVPKQRAPHLVPSWRRPITTEVSHAPETEDSSLASAHEENETMKRRIAAAAMLVAGIAACAPDTPPAPPAVTSQPAAAEPPVTLGQDGNLSKGAAMQELAEAPPAGDVIYAVTHEKGDGSDSYKVEHGTRWAQYWYGHRFEHDGKQYFTGFVYLTPPRYGPESEVDHFPEPGAKVSIAEASFVQIPTPDGPKWHFIGAEPFIGEFGGSESANIVDESPAEQIYVTSAGNRLLAVPTWQGAPGGVIQRSVELFLLHSAYLPALSRGEGLSDPSDPEADLWRYVGNVMTGEDNSNGCASGPDSDLPPCVSSSAKLEFLPQADRDMPMIRTVMQGTDVEGPGGIHKVWQHDTKGYQFDPESGIYQPIKE